MILSEGAAEARPPPFDHMRGEAILREGHEIWIPCEVVYAQSPDKCLIRSLADGEWCGFVNVNELRTAIGKKGRLALEEGRLEGGRSEVLARVVDVDNETCSVASSARRAFRARIPGEALNGRLFEGRVRDVDPNGVVRQVASPAPHRGAYEEFVDEYNLELGQALLGVGFALTYVALMLDASHKWAISGWWIIAAFLFTLCSPLVWAVFLLVHALVYDAFIDRPAKYEGRQLRRRLRSIESLAALRKAALELGAMTPQRAKMANKRSVIEAIVAHAEPLGPPEVRETR